MAEAWATFADVMLRRAVLDDPAPAVEAARDELKRSLEVDTPFAWLVAHASLDLDEAEALAVIAAVEIDVTRQQMVGALAGDGSPWLTPFTLQLLFAGSGPEESAAAPGRGLWRAALLLPDEGPTWATSPLRLAPLVPWWLLGSSPSEPDLPYDAEVVDVEAQGDGDLVVVVGADRVRRLQAVVASLAAPRLLVTPPPAGRLQWDALVRYATLSGRGVVVELDGDAGLSPEARSRIDRADHLPWAIASRSELPVESLPRRPWSYAQAGPPPATAAELASVFGSDAAGLTMSLTATQVQHVASLAPRFGADAVSTVRWLAHGHLDQLATQIRPVATWDDLILSPDRRTLVEEVLIRQQHRRQVFDEWGMASCAPAATIAMFSGPSGTGKTLAAEVIAGALGLDLYQIDVSQLVSKYIGETEKNLGRVFDGAESVPCVLFFDEADALFGKRSEVSDAHDRYANIEVAYLLQRLERHNGIVILASNLASNLDDAFMRRIHVSVDFPMPGREERRQIWNRCLPAPAYRGPDLDVDDLAERFELSGGNIRNAALRAAFLAADSGTPITMPLVIEALRREMRKLRRLVTD